MEINCIICKGKYTVKQVASTLTSEYVCKEHVEAVINHLQEKKK